MSEWTPVSERLPPAETNVLLYHRDGVMYEGYTLWTRPSPEDTFERFLYFIDADGIQEWEWGDITHWQPLPEPPKG